MESELSDSKRQAEKQIKSPEIGTPSFRENPHSYEILLEIASQAIRSRTKMDLFHHLCPHLHDLTGSDFVNLSLYDATQNCMLTHFWKPSREIGEFDAFAVGECMSGHVWTTQKPIAISNIEGEAGFPACTPALRRHGVLSYSVLPISTEANRYGALGLGRSDSCKLGTEDIEFLSRIAHLVALALENQEIHSASIARQERLQSLVAISREMSRSLDFDQLTAIVLDNLRRTIHYDHAALALFEEDGTTLKLYGVESPEWEPHLAHGLRMPLAQSPSADAIVRRHTAFLGTADLDEMGTPLALAMRRGGIRNLCIVPICSPSRAWGSLTVGNTRENTLHQEDAEFLQQIASQIAGTMDNARAYREIAQLKDRLAGEKHYLENEARAEKRWDEIVGNSPSLKHVMEHASIVANTNSTVLITGETGTGKERVAHSIHEMSARRERSFIKLNCAAIPTGLVESELFGHERGAFTGAVSQKLGRLELADKGTLFLDEIGEISLELQPKLLRVLQDQEFERLGGTRTIHVDVRLIAATNRDLGLAVEENEFRRDLFYRLHVFPLHVPALRDRRDDIPLLVRHFVEKSSARLKKRIELIPDNVIEALMNWSWPGNIRELENFIERSVILSRGNVLHAPLTELRQENAQAAPNLDTSLRSKEREHIIEVLRQSHGLLSGPSGAAARLGLKRTTLQYKMQKLGISRLDYLN